MIKKYRVQIFENRLSVQHPPPPQRCDTDLQNVYLVIKILYKVLYVEEPKYFSVSMYITSDIMWELNVFPNVNVFTCKYVTPVGDSLDSKI